MTCDYIYKSINLALNVIKKITTLLDFLNAIAELICGQWNYWDNAYQQREDLLQNRKYFVLYKDVDTFCKQSPVWKKTKKFFDSSNNQRLNLALLLHLHIVAVNLKYIMHYGSVQYWRVPVEVVSNQLSTIWYNIWQLFLFSIFYSTTIIAH